MARGESTPARYGLPDTAAMRQDLAVAGLWPPQTDRGAEQQTVLSALARSGRPALAARNLAAFLDATRAGGEPWRPLVDDGAFRARLIGLFGASETLGEHVATQPDAWRRLAEADPFAQVTAPRRSAALLGAALADRDGHPLPRGRAIARLRREYRTQLAVIAAADVAGGVSGGAEGPTVREVGIALAALADGVLAAALELAASEHPAPGGAKLAIIAMGKCGANELNYLSDVDVLFVADDAPRGAGADSDQILRALTVQATDVMTICREVAWDVDAALRPEGGAGPLVRTVAGYLAYYQKWAKTWEFQALLKARAAAGDLTLGAAFVAAVGPLVWSAANRDDFVIDVHDMRRRVRESVPPQARDGELKLSAGGLRDVEFAVQLLQLVHGRADESLRLPGTLAALDALTAGGYVGRADGAELADAYAFERRIEHLSQLQHLRRTHSLPASDDDRRWLARAAGLGVAGGRDPLASLAADVARHESTIRRLHEKLFYRPLLAAVAAVPSAELRLTEAAAAVRLAALGFAAPQPALRHIAALTEGVSRRAAIQRTLLPVLLGTFAESPDPDRGLLGYRTVSDALADTPWYLRLLRDEGLVAGRLARLLGISRLVADLLERAPEVLRLLADGGDLKGPDAGIAAASAAEALAARAGRARTAEAAVAAARSARRHEMLRLACADLLGLADTDTVMSGLTAIADATVLAALGAAHRSIRADRPDGELSATVSVIAMGRFGGAEMGYSSDADVLFVATPTRVDADPAAVSADAAAIAELTARLLGRPSPDPPLTIDADLRPEGRSGPLVRTVTSYLDYWGRRIQPWERQALLRARAIDPHDVAAAQFIAAIGPLRYPADGLPPGEAREIRRIKARVDTERLPHHADRTLHTKLGRGGLADIEWTVQLLQLQHAGHTPALRVTGTIAAIRAAAETGIIEQVDAGELEQGWYAATRARNAIMLVTGKPGDEIPPHGTVLAGIARACGYPGTVEPGAFVDDYRRQTRHARRVVDALFDRT